MDSEDFCFDGFQNKVWRSGGLLHRTNGPAIEYSNGDLEWFVNGRRHREDGPSFIKHSYEYKEWWINGHRIKCNTQEEFEKLLRLKAFW